MPSLPFRFDARTHEYIALDTGEVLPHITGMLLATGRINDAWFTQDGRERGSAVHKLTADYDMGALDVADCASRYRDRLLGYVGFSERVKPEVLTVEEAIVHPVHRYAGRPDRVVKIGGVVGILEIKTGAFEELHCLQTALQAILVAADHCLKPEDLGRWVLYLRDKGKFKLESHKATARDFADARSVIRSAARA